MYHSVADKEPCRKVQKEDNGVSKILIFNRNSERSPRITEMDVRIDQIRENCTPETGIDDIRTDRELFDKSPAKLRVSAEEAMRGLGADDFGG